MKQNKRPQGGFFGTLNLGRFTQCLHTKKDIKTFLLQNIKAKPKDTFKMRY